MNFLLNLPIGKENCINIVPVAKHFEFVYFVISVLILRFFFQVWIQNIWRKLLEKH